MKRECMERSDADSSRARQRPGRRACSQHISVWNTIGGQSRRCVTGAGRAGRFAGRRRARDDCRPHHVHAGFPVGSSTSQGDGARANGRRTGTSAQGHRFGACSSGPRAMQATWVCGSGCPGASGVLPCVSASLHPRASASAANTTFQRKCSWPWSCNRQPSAVRPGRSNTIRRSAILSHERLPRTSSATVAASRSGSTGFRTYRSKPASRSRCRSSSPP